MKIKLNLTVVLLLVIFVCCRSQNNINTSAILLNTKNEIDSQIDSASYYYDLVFIEHDKEISNALKIDKFSIRIQEFRNKINLMLNEIGALSKKGKLEKSEYDAWLKNIDFSSLQSKNEKVKLLGIDFSTLPITSFYELSKLHKDSTHSFSLNFPSNWLINDHIAHSFMANGLIGTDPNLPSNIGAIGLDITLNKTIPTDQFYLNNITTIKEDFENLSIVEEKDIQINGISAKYVSLHFKYNELVGSSIQVYFIKSGNGYIFSGSVPKDDFEQFRYLFIEILRTIKFNDE